MSTKRVLGHPVYEQSEEKKKFGKNRIKKTHRDVASIRGRGLQIKDTVNKKHTEDMTECQEHGKKTSL
jgi:hypothetical protein